MVVDREATSKREDTDVGGRCPLLIPETVYLVSYRLLPSSLPEATKMRRFVRPTKDSAVRDSGILASALFLQILTCWDFLVRSASPSDLSLSPFLLNTRPGGKGPSPEGSRHNHARHPQPPDRKKERKIKPHTQGRGKDDTKLKTREAGLHLRSALEAFREQGG